MIICSSFSSIHSKLYDFRTFCLFCSLSQHLEKCLTHSRCSIKLCSVNKCIKRTLANGHEKQQNPLKSIKGDYRQLSEGEISRAVKYMKIWLISHQNDVNEITFFIYQISKNSDVRKQKGSGKVETPKHSWWKYKLKQTSGEPPESSQ